MNAELSYVFLLLDLSDYGELTLEVDDLDWSAEKMSNMVGKSGGGHDPLAAGLLYECDPLQTWRIRYDGNAAATAPHGQQVLWTPGEPSRQEMITYAKINSRTNHLQHSGICGMTTLKHLRKI